MAKFSYAKATNFTGFTWDITELGSPFDSTNYMQVALAVADSPFPSGMDVFGLILNYGVTFVSWVEAGKGLLYPNTEIILYQPAYSTFCYYETTAPSVHVYPVAITAAPMGANGRVWGITESGSVPENQLHPGVTINLGTVTPYPFYWSNYGASPTNVTTYSFIPKATAWNALNAKIAEWYAYKNMSGFTYTNVSQGNPFLGHYLDNAAGGINALRGWTYLDFSVSLYEPIFPAARVCYQLEQQVNLIT